MRALIPAKEPGFAVRAGTALRALIPAKEPGLAMRDDTALQALPTQMEVPGVSARQARSPRRAQEIRRRARPALRADTALQAPPRLKDPGLAMPEVSLPALPILPRALLVRLGLTACLGSLNRPAALPARYSSCKTSQSQIGKIIPTPRALALPSRLLPAGN